MTSFPLLYSRYPRLPHSKTLFSTRIFYLFLLFPLLLSLLHHLSPATFHLNFPGTPASSLPLPSSAQTFPAAYFGANARFLFYTSSYGQLNNQVAALFNALFVARKADAVLVLPYTSLGKESLWDLKRAGHPEQADIPRQLVADYFNYSRLAAREHVVRPSHFFASVDAHDLLSRHHIVVSHRSGNPYRKLFSPHAQRIQLEQGVPHMRVFSHSHSHMRLRDVCDFSLDGTLEPVQGLGVNDRFVMLPVMFRQHNLNCSVEEVDWVSIRKGLIPRDEFLRAVDTFIGKLKRPVLAIHLRVFLNGDVGNFSAESFVTMLEHKFGEQMKAARTLFLAYSPSSDVGRQAFELLKEKFRGNVVDGSRIGEHFAPADKEFGLLGLAGVLMDMWVSVKSDWFVGRLGSSLSWNVVYWRQALQEEYALEKGVVERPLWYTLKDFSNSGAARDEGDVMGAPLRNHWKKKESLKTVGRMR